MTYNIKPYSHRTLLISLRGVGAFCCVALLLAMAKSVEAEADYSGALSIIVENDTVSGSDNNYTNGLGLVWTSNDVYALGGSEAGRRLVNLGSFLPGVDSAERAYVSLSLAQEMHTPDDISDPVISSDDQPYAGMLYVDSTIHTRKAQSGHAWSLRLGVVGPASQADHTQRWFHRLVDADEPQGWDSQLPNEPIFNVGYTYGQVWREGALRNASSWRLVPMVNVEVGNYVTAAGVGSFFEFGRNLSPMLAISGLGRGFESMFTAGGVPSRDWSYSGFVGFGGYAIAHYLPLDGTVFRDSRSIASDNFAASATMGFAVRKDRFASMFSITKFSETFATERETVSYGNFTLSWYF